MAKVVLISFLLCFLLATFSVQFSTAANLPPATSECSTVIHSMNECLRYVAVGSNVAEPNENSTCCQAFKSALRADQAICLCTAVNEANVGELNMTRLGGLTLSCHAPQGFDPSNCVGKPTTPGQQPQAATPSGQPHGPHPVAPVSPGSLPSQTPSSPPSSSPTISSPPMSEANPSLPSSSPPISSPPMSEANPPTSGSAFKLAASSTVATVVLAAIVVLAA